ncbi:hypothetical protein GUJ93_ZPchr0004g38592 [Zizania palustris]|uniref:Uncharacterized protein n=1 Tax=Zizania palustris TaxID=103762 RepID=A0A8J5V8Q5_ZIZPA|nr:hypothetical protein GUJ93_ZPchr0004g38592 [Zizania palustris]
MRGDTTSSRLCSKARGGMRWLGFGRRSAHCGEVIGKGNFRRPKPTEVSPFPTEKANFRRPLADGSEETEVSPELCHVSRGALTSVGQPEAGGGACAREGREAARAGGWRWRRGREAARAVGDGTGGRRRCGLGAGGGGVGAYRELGLPVRARGWGKRPLTSVGQH